jgi:hypothetical protein
MNADGDYRCISYLGIPLRADPWGGNRNNEANRVIPAAMLLARMA